MIKKKIFCEIHCKIEVNFGKINILYRIIVAKNFNFSLSFFEHFLILSFVKYNFQIYYKKIVLIYLIKKINSILKLINSLKFDFY